MTCGYYIEMSIAYRIGVGVSFKFFFYDSHRNEILVFYINKYDVKSNFLYIQGNLNRNLCAQNFDIRAPRKKTEIERFSVSRKFFRFLYDVSLAFCSQYFLYRHAKEKLRTKALECEAVADVL